MMHYYVLCFSRLDLSTFYYSLYQSVIENASNFIIITEISNNIIYTNYKHRKILPTKSSFYQQ